MIYSFHMGTAHRAGGSKHYCVAKLEDLAVFFLTIYQFILISTMVSLPIIRSVHLFMYWFQPL